MCLEGLFIAVMRDYVGKKVGTLSGNVRMPSRKIWAPSSGQREALSTFWSGGAMLEVVLQKNYLWAYTLHFAHFPYFLCLRLKNPSTLHSCISLKTFPWNFILRVSKHAQTLYYSSPFAECVPVKNESDNCIFDFFHVFVCMNVVFLRLNPRRKQAVLF